LVFGAGMIMTRGCASRLLILSANGNLRALLSGLIFAVTAQASLSGSLAPLRNTLSAWWTVEGGPSRDLLAITGAGNAGGIVFGLVWLAAALWFSVRSGRSVWKWVGGIGTGLTIAAGWGYTHLVSINSFQVVQVQGLTFSGLAGGCAVGAGLTGGAIFALTAWLALVGMWLGAGLTDRLLDGKAAGQRIAPPP
ncbi:MAG: hypothetical protein B7Y54_15585, partial [Polaromonas sp. 35-63-240]